MDGPTPGAPPPRHLQACCHGHTATAALLLAGGASVTARNKYGASALHLAAAAGHISTVRVVLGAGAAVEEEAGQRVGCPTPVMVAALHGRDGVLRTLLGAGGRVDRLAAPGRWTPLMMAAAAGSRTTTQLLLEAGADPDRLNIVSATALEIAMALEHREVEAFLARRTEAAPRVPGQMPEQDLMEAARQGNLARVEQLLATGDHDIDETDGEGATPLILASMAGHLHLVQVGS